MQKIKKILKVFIVLGIISSLFFFGIILYFWSEWEKKSNNYLQQVETYFNSLIRFSSEKNRFTYIQNQKKVSYTMYPIKVLDKYNQTIGYIKTNNKIIVSLDKVSPHFINALISTEDKNFYNHDGVSFIGILRAAYKNITSAKLVQGGSTITQQLSKLLLSNQEKTFSRKINEFFIAMNIEKNYTKNDILFMYINLIYFGYNIYGVGLASEAYFGKSIKDLNTVESALLVSLISNPSFYNPYKRVENTQKKHLAVLLNMYDKGFLTKEQVINNYKDFWRSPTLLPSISLPYKNYNNKALYVIEEVKRFLSKKYGNSYLDDLQGSTIYTTIDLNIQNYLDNNVPIFLKKFRDESSLSKEEKKHLESGSVISYIKTGEIIAFNGGSYFSTDNQFNRAFQAKRQIGSTIKPFLYMVGLSMGNITPYTIFEDVPIEVELNNKIIWSVNNYAESYRGYLNVSDALKRSSNVIAVQVVNEIGIKYLQDFFKKALDISEQEVKELFTDDQYSVALGTVNLSPLQLNQLYQIIANEGKKEELYFVSEIEDLNGSIIFKHNPVSYQVISKESIYLIKKILSTVFEPGGSGNYVRRNYDIKSEIGGKSGTTQNNRDIWFSGFTNRLAMSVWLGNDNNKSLGSNFLGGIQSGQIFGSVMQWADQFYASEPFTKDSSYNIVESNVDLLTGFLPDVNSLFIKNGEFIKGTEPKKSIYLPIEKQLSIAEKKKLLKPKQIESLKREYATEYNISNLEKKEESELLDITELE